MGKKLENESKIMNSDSSGRSKGFWRVMGYKKRRTRGFLIQKVKGFWDGIEFFSSLVWQLFSLTHCSSTFLQWFIIRGHLVWLLISIWELLWLFFVLLPMFSICCIWFWSSGLLMYHQLQEFLVKVNSLLIQRRLPNAIWSQISV